jgi:cytochrome c oxidase subunit 2
MDGPQSTLITEGPVALAQKELFYVTLWVTIFIFITVGSALAYAQFKFLEPKDSKGDEGPPPQTHGHPLVEIGLIVASTLLLVIIAIPTVKGIWYQEDVPEGSDPLVIKVTGYQWWFKFEYPELGVVTANEMIIPTNRPVHLDLRTADVIHSFWVPRLAGKKDLMPNRANHMWLQADRSDYYWAQCAEFCGESHANMKFRVISLDEPGFEAWAQNQKADARVVDAAAATAAVARPRVQFAAHSESEPDIGMAGAESPFEYWQWKQVLPKTGTENVELVNRGRELFVGKTCVQCHTIRGLEFANGLTAPDLTHFGSRTTLAAAMRENTPENLRAWITNPESVKPGNLMWRDGYVVLDSETKSLKRKLELTDEDVEALATYLESLK